MAAIKSAAERFAAGTFEKVSWRSVFVKVNPAPTTLTERRAVLRALQKHGGIEVFKRLANPSSFIAVANASVVAQELIDRSPIDFRFVDEPFDSLPTGTPFWAKSTGLAAPIEPVDPAKPNENRHLQKAFTLHVFPSEGYKHKTVIRYSPLHGPWPKSEDGKDTFVYSALRQVVPAGVPARGLCDWRTGGQLSDEAKTVRTQMQNPKVAHIMERQQRQSTEMGILAQLKGLTKLHKNTTADEAEQPDNSMPTFYPKDKQPGEVDAK